MIRYDHIDYASYKTLDLVKSVMSQGGSIGLQCANVVYAIKQWPKKPQYDLSILVSEQSELIDIHSPDRAMFKKWHQHRQMPHRNHSG